MPSRRSLPTDTLRALAACAALLALPAAAGGVERTELVFLAVVLAPALLATARLAPPPGAELGLAATLVVAAAWSLPASPTRSAVLVVIVLVALLVAAARRARLAPWTAGEWLLLILAMQTLCRGDLLLQPGFVAGERARLAAVLLALPAAAALAAWVLAGIGRGWAIAAIALLFAAQGGLHTVNTLLVVALAGLAYFVRSRLPPPARGALPAIGGALLAAVVTATAAFPWLEPRPLRTALALPAEFVAAARARDLLAGGELVLDAASPSWEGEAGRRTRQIALVSNLANAAVMAAGTPVATLEARAEDGEVVRFVLRNGTDTGEWAARRGDVLALAPHAWQSMVVDDFFAQRYRASWRLEPPRRLTTLRLMREPGLPPETKLAIFALEVRP